MCVLLVLTQRKEKKSFYQVAENLNIDLNKLKLTEFKFGVSSTAGPAIATATKHSATTQSTLEFIVSK